ncbi:MAG: hypothetical protein JW776_09090 [Candidatus Lokiarchaeota archaeon]|nr:hypothetical protein [Candidatus Lokiarchaeota archaeon]
MVLGLTNAQIQTFVINGSILIFILIIGSSVLRRNPNSRLNRSFFLFYFFVAFGLLINVAYRLINKEIYMVWMNRITLFFSTFGIIFLLFFNIIIFQSEQVFTRKKQWLYTILWFIACSGILWLDLENGVKWDYNPNKPGIDPLYLNPGSAGVPVYSTLFTVYALILAQGLFIIIIILVARIIRKFGDKKLRRKYISSFVAIMLFDWILVGNLINNWSIVQDAYAFSPMPFSTVFLYTSVLVIPAVLLLWYGIRKRD